MFEYIDLRQKFCSNDINTLQKYFVKGYVPVANIVAMLEEAVKQD